MGLLSEGTPMSWEETHKHADHVRKHGIKQFINQYNKHKNRDNDVFYWGDEIEYMLVKFDEEKKTAKLRLNAQKVLTKLQHRQILSPHDHPTTWLPEYASFMVEGTPGKPYGGLMNNLNSVESNMKLRKKELQQVLAPNEVALTMTVYPRLGVGDFTDPPTKPTPDTGASKSIFCSDEIINQRNPRFMNFTRNIRQRRGKNMDIQVPVYTDRETPTPFMEDFSHHDDYVEAAKTAKPDHIYMDCMGYGFGCLSLQVTFQASNIMEARLLYDHLVPIAPVMLALGAASPVFRGYLSDNDVRWNVIAHAIDDRTEEEKGIKELENDRFRIPKSRYDSVSSYLTPRFKSYNDIELPFDQNICNELQRGGVDETLARHIAHIFIRDTCSLFKEKLNQDDGEETDHFENIQSTNWQTLRFKIPPPNSSIGWRVEFRPMEVQPSSFENAAYAVFVMLLTRVILSEGLNFVIPLSKVDANMATAQKRDAVNREQFYFRKDIYQDNSTDNKEPTNIASETCKRLTFGSLEEEYHLMSLNEIINGSEKFTGLIPLIQQYLNSVDINLKSRCSIQKYLKLISNRASGVEPTIAKTIRNFIRDHPDYKHDSLVSELITYDLLKFMKRQAEESETQTTTYQIFSEIGEDIPLTLSDLMDETQTKRLLESCVDINRKICQ